MIGAPRPVRFLVLTFLAIAAGDAVAAIIPVTTVVQKISGSEGCSLQEAIYSANLDSNVAIAGYSGTSPIEVVTQCVPGNGDDIIVLPAGALFRMSKAVDDAMNPTGPTATPIVTSNITILAYGATLQRVGAWNFRLFAVANTGHLTIRRASIRGFFAQGGDGHGGGGAGMGAGGAIYVAGGVLVLDANTFDSNSAVGGRTLAEHGEGGGGGGIGGSGGPGSTGGGGGGGARGNGGGGAVNGGGGGGTVSDGEGGGTRRGGFDCGGRGGSASDGQNGQCAGGGGGGAGDDFTFEPIFPAKHGGHGQYGGGGGGGAEEGNGSGGRGGFGGGGGSANGLAACDAGDGGDGGFGAGGGSGGESVFCSNGEGGSRGFFAGEGGDGGGGGGGAGLGGHIFNDSGTIDIRNSTFVNGFVAGGFSAGSEDGTGGGGAIFSRNGHLTVLNSTISGNIANFGGGLMVVQDPKDAPISFVLENTIIANNGFYECALQGSIGSAFAGNLIENNTPDGTVMHHETFGGCQGVVTSGDPQLGPLQNNQGATPTMAISATSPARNAADPATSLPVDQRKQPRPANLGYDIGAFELCLTGFGNLEQPCIILAGIEDPGGSNQAVTLTMQVNPLASGTTIPPGGTQDVAIDSVVAVMATPKPGFRFTSWSQNVTDPGNPSTTVVMTAQQTVTANFAACKCAADVTSSIGITYGGLTNTKPGRYEQTVTLTNNSAATIAGPLSLVLDNLDPNTTVLGAGDETELMLPAGSPYINIKTNLAPGQSVAIQLRFMNAVDGSVTYTTRVLAGKGER